MEIFEGISMQIRRIQAPAAALRALSIQPLSDRLAVATRVRTYRAEMLCDMHERGSLNYRHHAKSYFITVVVWAYSFHPSVSIKFDERRRRRRRSQQDRSLVTRLHLRSVDNYYLLWSIWLVLKIYTNKSSADNQLAVIYAKRKDSMQILNDFTLANKFRYRF